MNGISSRIVMPRPGRRVLTAVLLIGTVLLGTMAMHSMMTSDMPADAAVAESLDPAVAPPDPDAAATAGASAHLMSMRSGEPGAEATDSAPGTTSSPQMPCTGSCATDSLMVGIMCAVLLAAVIVVRLPRRGHPSVASDLLRRIDARVAARPAPLRPPSLDVLSISRT